MTNLAILGSTRGTSMQPILQAIQQKELAASVQIVISNKADALILDRAKEKNINAQFVNPLGLSREEYDKKVSLLLQEYAVELIVLIGYMRILSSEFVEEWQNKIINVHPSLLPAFAGKMDLDVHQEVLLSGCKETGCTVHYVTKEIDAGPILVQKTCPILAHDTAEILKSRVQQLEGVALVEAIKKISVIDQS